MNYVSKFLWRKGTHILDCQMLSYRKGCYYLLPDSKTGKLSKKKKKLHLRVPCKLSRALIM